MKVLIVEDYQPLRQSLSDGLVDVGFAVDATGDGEEGLWYARDDTYDVIVLDLMLPKLDGLSILRKLREGGGQAAVLILTAKDQVEDRVRGLDQGADDYVVKPFAFEELLARVNALVRRKYGQPSPVIRAGPLEVDTKARRVTLGGEPVTLTAREYAILEIMLMSAGCVVTRTEIYNHLYGFDAEPDSNVVDVHICQLRHKLERNGASGLIQTRRGLGYVLQEYRDCEA